MKQALRLCRTGCGRCVSTARSIFVKKKKKKQLAHLKEDAVRLRAKRNRLHTELARLSSERNRLSSECSPLFAMAFQLFTALVEIMVQSERMCKVNKIRELSRRGVDGEARNATRLLQQELQKGLVRARMSTE